MAAGTQFDVVISAVDDASVTLAKIAASLDKVTKTIAAMDDPLRKIKEKSNFGVLAESAKKAAERVKEIGKSTDQALKLADGAKKSAGRIKEIGRAAIDAFEPLAALTALFTAGGIIKANNDALAYAQTLGNMAQRTGTSIEKLQELGRAAELAGVDQGTFNSAMVSFTDHIGQALLGKSPEFIQAINKMGYSLDDVRRMTPDERIRKLGAAVHGIVDPAQRAAVGAIVFGGAWGSLAPFIDQPADAIQRLIDKSNAWTKISDDQQKALRDEKVEWANLGIGVQSIGQQIAALSAGPLTDILRDMNAWLAANQAWLAKKISDVIVELAHRIEDLVHWLGQVDPETGLSHWDNFIEKMKPVAEALGKVINFISWLAVEHPYVALTALAVYLGGGFVVSIGLAVLAILGPGGLVSAMRKASAQAALTQRATKAAMDATAANAKAAATAASVPPATAAASVPPAGKALSGTGLIAKAIPFAALAIEAVDAAKNDTRPMEKRSQDFGENALGWIPGLGGIDWNKPLFNGFFGGGDNKNSNVEELLRANKPPEAPKVEAPPAPAAPFNPPTLIPDSSKADPQEAASQAIAMFQSKKGGGFTAEQAAGLVANMFAESKFDPGAVGDSGKAYGLLQWHPDRQENFKKWAGHDIHGTSREEQERFAVYELTEGAEQRAGARLRAAHSANEAGQVTSANYVRPRDRFTQASLRGGLADKFAAQQGKVQIDVNIANAPPGTSVKTVTSDPTLLPLNLAKTGKNTEGILTGQQ